MEYLERAKRRLARMALGALRRLHARGRLMEGALWQLNSYLLSCLEKAGEGAAGAGGEELGCALLPASALVPGCLPGA